MLLLAACAVRRPAPPSDPPPAHVAVAPVASANADADVTHDAAAPPASSPADIAALLADAGAEPLGEVHVERCRGLVFDLDQLPRGCQGRASAPPGPKDFAVDLTPFTTTVRSGEAIELELTLTNTTDHDVELEAMAGCARFEVRAYAGSRRVDEISECVFGSGCGGSFARIVVEPQGTVRKHLRFVAETRIARQATCIEGTVPLRPGRYDLVVHADDNNFPLAKQVAKVRRTITVTR